MAMHRSRFGIRLLTQVVLLSCIAMISVLAGCLRHGGSVDGRTRAPLVLVRTIPLPTVAGPVERNGIAGRLDHMAYDAATNRLFLAAFSKGSLEVIDLTHGKLLKGIGDIPEAQGVAIDPALGRVFVTSGDRGTVQAFDISTLNPVASAPVIDDADNVRFDSRSGRIFVGGGGKTDGAIVAMDPATLSKLVTVQLPGHAESFQLDPASPRLFANIPGDKYSDKDGVVVFADRDNGSILGTWTLQGAARNFAMAIDPERQRLFVVSRKPAKLVTLDTATGHVLATAPCVPDCDDVFYDAKIHRLLVIGGGRRTTDRADDAVDHDQAGALDVFSISDANVLKRIASLPLPPHARTGLYVPEYRMLYVAVPVQGDKPAELREYHLAD